MAITSNDASTDYSQLLEFKDIEELNNKFIETYIKKYQNDDIKRYLKGETVAGIYQKPVTTIQKIQKKIALDITLMSPIHDLTNG